MFVEFHPDAGTEFVEQVLFYETQEPELGQRFIEAIDAALALLLLQPQLGRPLDGGVRKFVLQELPFSVVYRIKPGRQIWIAAVAHNRRRPDYWRARMAEPVLRYAASSTTTAVP